MVYALAKGLLAMAISKLVEQKAINAYIQTNGNKTQTYLAAHPSADWEIADAHCSEFVGRSGIEEKAIATVKEIANLDPELSAEKFLEGFKSDMNANKTIFYKGKRHDDIPDNNVRANTRLQLFDRLFPTDKLTTAIQNNVININSESIDKVNKGLSELFDKSSALLDKLNGAKEI